METGTKLKVVLETKKESRCCRIPGQAQQTDQNDVNNLYSNQSMLSKYASYHVCWNLDMLIV